MSIKHNICAVNCNLRVDQIDCIKKTQWWYLYRKMAELETKPWSTLIKLNGDIDYYFYLKFFVCGKICCVCIKHIRQPFLFFLIKHSFIRPVLFCFSVSIPKKKKMTLRFQNNFISFRIPTQADFGK